MSKFSNHDTGKPFDVLQAEAAAASGKTIEVLRAERNADRADDDARKQLEELAKDHPQLVAEFAKRVAR
jgi:hypothetical protein